MRTCLNPKVRILCCWDTWREPASTRRSSPGIPAQKSKDLKYLADIRPRKVSITRVQTDKLSRLGFKTLNIFQPSDKQSPCVPPTPCLPNVSPHRRFTNRRPHYRNAHHACILPVENRIVLIPMPAKILPPDRLLDVVKMACIEKRMRVWHIGNSWGGRLTIIRNGRRDHDGRRARVSLRIYE